LRAKRVLQRAGVPFTEIDIDQVPGAEAAMKALNGGSGKVPTVLIESAGKQMTLIEPSERELAETLRRCSTIVSELAMKERA
jgi:mycoredoxin